MSLFDKLPRDDPARRDMGGNGHPEDPENYRCARCKRPGSLYDGSWQRHEGLVCWVCVDNEPHDEDEEPGMNVMPGFVNPTVTCAACQTEMPETHCCDGALGEKCPRYPGPAKEDAR